ncbi:MAG: hypothetical protein LAN64_06210 [Acidobacteriia bacterium]|nr:hypothetical protein [Terriglobia bacterium]
MHSQRNNSTVVRVVAMLLLSFGFLLFIPISAFPSEKPGSRVSASSSVANGVLVMLHSSIASSTSAAPHSLMSSLKLTGDSELTAIRTLPLYGTSQRAFEFGVIAKDRVATVFQPFTGVGAGTGAETIAGAASVGFERVLYAAIPTTESMTATAISAGTGERIEHLLKF